MVQEKKTAVVQAIHFWPLCFKYILFMIIFYLHEQKLHSYNYEFFFYLMVVKWWESYLQFSYENRICKDFPFVWSKFLLLFIFINQCRSFCLILFYNDISQFYCTLKCLKINRIEHFLLEHSIQKFDYFENMPQNFKKIHSKHFKNLSEFQKFFHIENTKKHTLEKGLGQKCIAWTTAG